MGQSSSSVFLQQHQQLSLSQFAGTWVLQPECREALEGIIYEFNHSSSRKMISQYMSHMQVQVYVCVGCMLGVAWRCMLVWGVCRGMLV